MVHECIYKYVKGNLNFISDSTIYYGDGYDEEARRIMTDYELSGLSNMKDVLFEKLHVFAFCD